MAVRLAIVAACAAVALDLSHEIAEGERLAADTAVLLWLHAHRSPAVQALATVLTTLGSGWGITPLAVAVTVVLSARGRRAAALVFAAGSLVASGLDALLKEVFERTRPQLWPHPPVAGDSFPSGHALVSTVVLGMCGFFVAQAFPKHRAAILTVTVLLVAGIAWSRLQLGVHWPSDVIAGMAFGYILDVILVAIIARLEARV